MSCQPSPKVISKRLVAKRDSARAGMAMRTAEARMERMSKERRRCIETSGRDGGENMLFATDPEGEFSSDPLPRSLHRHIHVAAARFRLRGFEEQQERNANEEEESDDVEGIQEGQQRS